MIAAHVGHRAVTDPTIDVFHVRTDWVSEGGFSAVTGRLKIDYSPAKLCKIIPGPASSAAPVLSYLFFNNNHDGMGQWQSVNSSSAPSCGRSAFTPAPGAIP